MEFSNIKPPNVDTESENDREGSATKVMTKVGPSFVDKDLPKETLKQLIWEETGNFQPPPPLPSADDANIEDADGSANNAGAPGANNEVEPMQ